MDVNLPPVSEDKLKKITIGEKKPHNAPIFLSEYDANWPLFFQKEHDKIKQALGPSALTIEHVGSTSIPWLIAKPIIDILLVVKDSSDELPYVPFLEQAGYILRIREPDWNEHRLFKGPDQNLNLHVFSQCNSEIEKMLLFRDYLRTHPDAKELYANTKRELSKKTWKYVQNYADAKTEVIEHIIKNAQSN